MKKKIILKFFFCVLLHSYSITIYIYIHLCIYIDICVRRFAMYYYDFFVYDKKKSIFLLTKNILVKNKCNLDTHSKAYSC